MTKRLLKKRIIFRVCSSLPKLLDTLRLENRELCEKNRELANIICLELAANFKTYLDTKKDFNDLEITRIDNLMDRIMLFESDVIDIRAHLFVAGAEETFIHNGQSFISTCLY